MGQHLPVISASEAIRAFTRIGYVVLPKRGKGSHTVLRHLQTGRILTIPGHDPVRRGTLRAIIRQAGMSVDEFRNLL
jgi:predicted RNA binding protein YcfA (HicA-like mRNA interferase family)